MRNLIYVDFTKQSEKVVDLQQLVKKALIALNLPSYGLELVCLSKDVLINDNREYLESWVQNYINRYEWDDEAEGMFLHRLRTHLKLSESEFED